MIQVQNWIIMARTYNMIVKTTNSAIILRAHSINNSLQKPYTKTKILDLPLTNLPGTYILDYWKRQFNIPVDEVYVFLLQVFFLIETCPKNWVILKLRMTSKIMF